MRKNIILLIVLLFGYLWWRSSDAAPELTSTAPLIKPIAATVSSPGAPRAAQPSAVAAIAGLPAASKADTAAKAAALLQQAITLRQCWNVPLDEPALEAWLQQATQGHQTPEQIFGMQERFAQCQQPFPATTNQSNEPNTSQQPALQHNYLNLLLQAAALGSDAAVQQLWTIAEPELVQQLQLTDLPRDEKIKRKQQFKQQQYQLAAAVAQAGGEQAALMLIRGYQHYDPATGGQSYDKALAYIDFLLHRSRNNDIYSQLQWQRDKLLTRMTEAEISQAQHMTEQFLLPR
jgi:hypothetical protein